MYLKQNLHVTAACEIIALN